MSSNAFTRLEREYNERQDAIEMAKAEREQVQPSQIRTEKLITARERHGKPFAFEKGSEWKPRAVPVLTEWMQHQTKEEKK